MTKELSFYADLIWLMKRASARNENENVELLLEKFPKLKDLDFLGVVEAYKELREFITSKFNIEELPVILH